MILLGNNKRLVPLVKTKMAMEKKSPLKIYFLLKMEDFSIAMLVLGSVT